MDAYEATRIVFSKLQNLDPENASKIMGFLLIQDHGEKEMVRLAFGPEALIHNLIITAYAELGLSSTPTPSSPSPFHPLARQNSASRTIPSSPWAAVDSLISPNSASSGPSYASVVATNGNSNGFTQKNSELIDEMNLQDQLSFLNDAAPLKNHDLFYPSPELGCTSPNNSDGMMFPGWGRNNGQHRRSLSVTDIGLGSDPFGWKPCLYYAKGYCKNGTSCRFLHGHLQKSIHNSFKPSFYFTGFFCGILLESPNYITRRQAIKVPQTRPSQDSEARQHEVSEKDNTRG